MDFLHGKKYCEHSNQMMYTIENPDPAVITMQDDLGSFTFITNVLGNQIQISIIKPNKYSNYTVRILFDVENYYQGMLDK
jgi:hypothetical protein